MRKLNRGFTLVELMIVVAIIGILAALAIYGVERYLANSKSAEAKQHVGAMSRGAIAAFERTFAATENVGEGTDSQVEDHTLCDSATPVPVGSPPAGTKYQPQTADTLDFGLGTPTQGWECLRFSITSPIHYQYNYFRNASPNTPVSPIRCVAGVQCFDAHAMGDLNGDGSDFSVIQHTGFVNPLTGALKAASALHIIQEAQ